MEWIDEPQVRARIDFSSRWDWTQRAFDIMLITVSAIFWIPLLLGILALKLLIDGRPVLFHHVRVGRDGHPFVLHKIRTTPAEYQPSAEDWPDENFPPRTRFGRWMQRFDFDELPQLWNVVKGDMSLVGPRPETPYHCANFARTLPGYMQRVQVRPGLTGLAQARGWRGNTSISQRLISDLEYLAHRGCKMYCITLLRTILNEARRFC
jgi:lipopolysaccharide/colanic/teichoic acid biosynthesis glycosyltransferase